MDSRPLPRTCQGGAVMISPADESARFAPDDASLGLGSLLAERESGRTPSSTVVLRAPNRGDAGWAQSAVGWLAAHGRRPIVRTSVVLPASMLDALREVGATVVLEVVHRDPALQRALLGAHADPAARLLLHAQHLRARDVPVAVHLGPLLPTIHDRPLAAEALVRHVVSADIRDAHLAVGALGPGRFDALRRVLDWGDLVALARAFDLRIDADGRVHRPNVAVHPSGRTREILLHDVRRRAQAAGLRIDACGCWAHCHLDPTHRTPAPLGSAELFPRRAVS